MSLDPLAGRSSLAPGQASAPKLPSTTKADPKNLPPDALRLGPAVGLHPSKGLSWVQAKGTQFVNEQGQALALRGMNLGGWMIMEPWMMPLGQNPPVKDEATMWRILSQRFGPEGAQRIRDAYRKAWLGPQDFALMKDAGFNSVRLPFTYAAMQEPGAFERLDWAIAQAAEQGLYTILDLHGAPGGQSKEMHTGEADVNRFFKEAKHIQEAARLWRTIAQRYANRPEVLGYDLLNEPMGAKNAKELHAVHDQLYRAIREVDAKHIVMMEDGYKGIATLPNPKKMGWNNVAYSVHQYDFGAKDTERHLRSLDRMIRAIDRVERAKDVPIYMGEFNVPGASASMLQRFVSRLGDSGVDWGMWNHKVVMPASNASNAWAYYRNEGKAQCLNIHTDSEAELLRKIQLMHTEHLKAAPGATATFQAEAAKAASFQAPTHSAWSQFWNRCLDGVVSFGVGLFDRVRGALGIGL